MDKKENTKLSIKQTIKICIITVISIIAVSLLISGVVILKQNLDKKKQIAAEEARLAAQIEVPNVIGMTYDEALSQLGGDAEKRAKISVNLSSAYGDAKTTLGDIGYTNDAAEVVEDAVEIGNSGNILHRYMEQKELEQKPLELKVTRSVNATRLDRVIQDAIGETLHRDAQYSLNKHDDGTVSVTMGGGNVDADSKATAEAIGEILNNNWGGGAVSTEIIISGDNADTGKRKHYP